MSFNAQIGRSLLLTNRFISLLTPLNKEADAPLGEGCREVVFYG